jgi:hypothetical protein
MSAKMRTFKLINDNTEKELHQLKKGDIFEFAETPEEGYNSGYFRALENPVLNPDTGEYTIQAIRVTIVVTNPVTSFLKRI